MKWSGVGIRSYLFIRCALSKRHMDTISARVNSNNKVGEIHSTSVVARIFGSRKSSRTYYEKVCKIIRNYILIISINKNTINTFEFNDKRKTW